MARDMTGGLLVAFVFICAVCAALSLSAMAYTGSTLRQFSRLITHASTTLNALIDRLSK